MLNLWKKIYKFKPEHKYKFPSVIHNDGTGRLQTVTKRDNAFLWALLDKLESEYNIKLIINTSFNLNGEAIVNTVDDALRTFTSGIDELIIDRYCIKK